jgi:taurine dioxygenase
MRVHIPGSRRGRELCGRAVQATRRAILELKALRTRHAEPFQIVPTGAPLGAFVRNMDLSCDPPPEVMEAIRRAFAEHLVLIFRDQQLSQERLLAISEWFGPVHVPREDFPALGGEDQPLVVPISNCVEGGVLETHELAPHSDLQYLPVPSLGSVLYAVEIPARGGDTAWSNLYQAYDELDEPTKERLRGVRIWAANPYAGKYAIRNLAGPHQKFVDHELEPFPHPIVRTHPVTGRRALFVGSYEGGLLDLDDPEDAPALLERLRRHVARPHLYYTHRWRPGDLLIWDNRCTNHRRTAFDASERRVMYRVQIEGTIPV